MPRVQALSAGRRTLNRLLFSRCLPQEERTEICPVVVRIEIFSSLKEPYYQVGKGSGHHFIYHLEYPLCENRGQQQRRGNDAPKGKLVEITVSSPSPISVEPIVRVHNQRPFVAIFSFASTNELTNSPTR